MSSVRLLSQYTHELHLLITCDRSWDTKTGTWDTNCLATISPQKLGHKFGFLGHKAPYKDLAEEVGTQKAGLGTQTCLPRFFPQKLGHKNLVLGHKVALFQSGSEALKTSLGHKIVVLGHKMLADDSPQLLGHKIRGLGHKILVTTSPRCLGHKICGVRYERALACVLGRLGASV